MTQRLVTLKQSRDIMKRVEKVVRRHL